MEFDFDESIPIYIQIMRSVLWDTAIGALLPGDKVPSVRDLAKQAKANPNTVQRAYMELERMGVVETLRGQGTFVVADPGIARNARSEVTNSTVRSFVAEMRRLRHPDDDILRLVSERLTNSEDEERTHPATGGPTETIGDRPEPVRPELERRRT
ncbi:MAG: GntR family transcriptional regulator [Clostridia bacterium]|nr:GntR family transcriptional regulator [Clostridia bacterium]